MTELDKKLDLHEEQILDNMFEGDSKRDASDKIRGFLFQDLVAIDSLLDDNTEYVCLEYLEDVDVFCKDGTAKIIQVKYYAKSSPGMKEIATDLYYQYLRMQLLESTLTPKPQLVIYIENTINKQDLESMKKHFSSLKKEKPEKIADMPKWLKENVYKQTKKELQKKALFDEKAHVASVIDFTSVFEIIKKSDIKTYKNEIGEKLLETFSECSSYDDEDKRKYILLGLAINYIQKRYIQNNSKFEQLRVSKTEFIAYIEQTMPQKTEDHMIAYITSCVLEQYASILVQNPDLCDDHIKILNQIAYNTKNWIYEVLLTEEGQIQLLNTISLEEHDKIEKYKKLRASQKVFEIIRCADNLHTFLYYLWKIMLDLCMTKSDFSVKEDADMLNPQTYIDKTKNNYICVKFPMDCVNSSVILPAIRPWQEEIDCTNIATRMFLEKPQKWYMAGHICGEKDYNYPVSAIFEKGSVIDMEPDRFIIECMECIAIDRGRWNDIDECEACIFVDNCVKGKGDK